MTTLYGIKTCDTCRKAMKWLGNAGLDVTFHDLRRDGVPAARLRAWLDRLGTAELINRRSAAWRGLDATQRARAESAPEALLWEQPTLIRRPLLEHGETVLVGFRDVTDRDTLGLEAS